MTTITLDTQEAVIKLKAVGVSQEHADAFVRAIVESQNSLATKADIEIILSPIKTDLAVLKADSVTLNKVDDGRIDCWSNVDYYQDFFLITNL
jgi:hypothetical protein